MKIQEQTEAEIQARKFIVLETAFHLGDLITEKSHPKTRSLSSSIQNCTIDGLKLLLSVDQDIIPVTERAIESNEIESLISLMVETVKNGGRLVFSSCGASGRLAIILEAMWREYWGGQNYENLVLSIMTGGERALIRAVENFEDYQSFGRQQVVEADLNDKDLLIALTEGGEISSVIGTMKEAADRGSKVFMVYNNPRDLLIEKFQRSKDVLSDKRIQTIDLTSGPMALSGSTRMQTTTIGMLFVGIALEEACRILEGKEQSDRSWYLHEFASLLDQLKQIDALNALSEFVELESNTYNRGGRITYIASKYLLDIFSDTTERTPTFMIPPFRSAEDDVSPPPWSFAKDPDRVSSEAWINMLGREPRGLDWDSEKYSKMEAHADIVSNPPKLSTADILSYEIGNERDESRMRPGDLFLKCSINSDSGFRIQVCQADKEDNCTQSILIPFRITKTRMNLFEHLVIKLIFNTISTGSMAHLGRVVGNWMIQVDATNKKLIDRATRIIQHFSGKSYEESCIELHMTMCDPEIDRKTFEVSYVIQTLKRMNIEIQ